MSEYEKRGNVEIAALKKQDTRNYNVMIPGGGTPWEDRGKIGLIPAFFKTCFKSLFAHRALLDQIRRPEATSEATSFAMGCAAMWAIGIGIWDMILYYHFCGDPMHLIVDGQQYFIETALRVAGTFALVMLFLRLGTNMFVSLLGHTTSQQIPRVMIYNVLAYSLGPSIFAIIPVGCSMTQGIAASLPVLGWGIAAAWIFVNAMIGAKTRLYLQAREVLANVLLVSVMIVVVGTMIFAAAYFILWVPFGSRSVRPVPIQEKPVMNG